jgi:DNA-binding response OmpR family regulator
MARVLIIDDDTSTRDVLCQLLRREGYEAVEACSGREGVQCAQAAPMDVIILDMLLPDQNGLEVVRELRLLDPAVPIIAISGGGHTGTWDLLRVAGTFGVQRMFQKPFRLPELLQAVRDLTQGKDERAQS